MARVGQARLLFAYDPEPAHEALGGDRLCPGQVVPLRDDGTVAAGIVIGRGGLAAGHQQRNDGPPLQDPAAARPGGQQLPACPGQQSFSREDGGHQQSGLQPGLPRQRDLVLQRTAEHHVHHHGIEVKPIQSENLCINQQQAQPQALQQHGAEAQGACAARPKAHQQRQQAGEGAECQQVTGQGNGQIGQAHAAPRVVCQRYVAERDRHGQQRVAGHEQRPPGQAAPVACGAGGQGGVGRGSSRAHEGLGRRVMQAAGSPG